MMVDEMKPLWNHLTLGRPPTSIWSPMPGDFATSSFILTINKVLEDLSCQNQLSTEAAILSRLIYRMKSKFRADKGLKSMEKVNRGLLNYLKLSIERDYEYLKENTDSSEESTILPSRQMVEYVLIRTQGFAKLMCRIESVARTAAHFLKNRINLGQAWTVSVIAYSVISRIWLLSRYLLRRCCNWYNSLYPFVKKLISVGLEWMPREHTLPSDLKTWIAVPWIDEQIQCPTESQVSDSIFSLIRGDYDEESLETQRITQKLRKEIVMTKSDSNAASDVGEKIARESSPGSMSTPTRSNTDDNSTKNIKKKSKYNRTNPALNVIPDLGEKISRESFAASTSNAIKSTINHDITEKSTITVKKKKTSVKITLSNSVPHIDEDISREAFTPQSQQPKISKKKKDALSKMKTKEDLFHLLQKNTYPGLDKLQWSILRKVINKIILKLEKCPAASAKHKLLINQAIRSIRACVS